MAVVRFILLLILLSFFRPLYGQNDTTFHPQKSTALGFGFTGMSYFGDMNVSSGASFTDKFFRMYPGFDIVLRSDSRKLFTPKLHLGFARFVSQNPDLEAVIFEDGEGSPIVIQPNRYVETPMVYAEAGMNINFLKHANRFRPHLGFGLGVLSFSPKSKDGIALVRRRSQRAPTERNYEALTISVPLSLGLNMKFTNRFGLDFTYTYRIVGSDFLDNIAALGTQKGNDRLHSLKMGVHYILQEKRRPTIRKPIEQEPDPIVASTDLAKNSALQADCDSIINVYTVRVRELEENEKRNAQRIAELENQRPVPLLDCDSVANIYIARVEELEENEKRREEKITGLEKRMRDFDLIQLENKSMREQLDDNIRFMEQKKLENDSLLWAFAQKKQAASSATKPTSADADNKMLNALALKLSEKEKLLNAKEDYMLEREKKLAAKEAEIKEMKDIESNLLLLQQRSKNLQEELAKQENLNAAAKRALSEYGGNQVPAIAVNCSLGKGEVQERIIRYFESHGSDFEIENGKMVYSRVRLSQITKKPLSVSLFLTPLHNGQRQLVATFRLHNGTYLSTVSHPVESAKAAELVQSFVK